MAEPSDANPPAAFDAEYAIEAPLNCPQCKQSITTVQVVRLIRTRVNFISMLPRRGYVMVCPACHGILSAELGGMTRVV